MDITQGMGLAKDASLEMSKGVIDIGTKLANWGGVDTVSTMEDMQRAITGSHESVEKYGIKLNDATLSQYSMNMGLGDTFSKLTEADKAQVRYAAIVGSSQNAIDYWNDGQRSMSFRLGEVKEQLSNVGETMGMALLPMVGVVTEKMADAAEGMAKFGAKVSEGFGVFKKELELSGEPTYAFGEMFKTIFGFELPQAALWMVDDIIQGFQILWRTFKEIFDTIATPIIDIIKEVFTGVGGHADSIFAGIGAAFLFYCNMIKDTWDLVGKPLWDFVIQIIGWVKDMFMEHWDAIYNTFSTVINDMVAIWNNNLKPMFEAIGNFITNVLAPVFHWLMDNVISPVFGAIVQFISGAWTNGIKPIFTGIIDFITGVFSGDWSKAWDGVCSIFSGIFGGLGEIIKMPLNAVIGMINKAIDGINSISVSIPDFVPFVGGQTFGMDLNHINYLENGGILTEPTMLNSNTMAGEKNKGRQGQAEAVIPLDRLFTELNSMFNTGKEIILNIDGKEFMRATAPYQDEYRDYNRQFSY